MVNFLTFVLSETQPNFRPIFAEILRDLDAALARHLALERIPTRKRAATNILTFAQPR